MMRWAARCLRTELHTDLAVYLDVKTSEHTFMKTYFQFYKMPQYSSGCLAKAF